MEIFSAIEGYGDATRDADARAFAALMRHIKEVDGQQHTVIMVQVENEVGVLGDSRDRSPAADKAFAGPVPKELMDYLQRHKDTLAPELREIWAAGRVQDLGDLGAGFRSRQARQREIRRCIPRRRTRRRSRRRGENCTGRWMRYSWHGTMPGT